MESLHPIVALSPVGGLIAMIVLHGISLRATRGRGHLGPLMIGMLGAWITAAALSIWGSSKMIWLPGESPAPLWIMVFFATSGLGYGYFTFINLNTTSLRIRLLRELLDRPAGLERADILLSRYSGRAVTEARVQRLLAWGQIRDDGGRWISVPGFFAVLAGVIAAIRGFTYPIRGSLAKKIGRHPKLKSRRWIRGFLFVLLAAALGMLYQIGRDSELHLNATERTRMHAIPVALSQIYHGKIHDYTAWKEIAQPYQSSEGIETLLKKSNERAADPKGDTYFWLADDRGFSDLVNLSFRLYGPTMTGLYNGMFSLIVLSTVTAALGLRRSIPGMATIVLFVLAYASFLPNLYLAGGDSIFRTDYRVHLSESRAFEVLGLVFFLQSVALVISRHRPRLGEFAALAAQAGIFGFLYSCRSSLGWIVLGTLTLVMGYGIWFLYRLRTDPNFHISMPLARLLCAGLAASLLFAGILTGKGIHSLLENPHYLAEGGARTFYHNALMGLAPSKQLAAEFGFAKTDDGTAIDCVNAWLEKSGRSAINRQKLLDALGGYGNADWHAYETAAKEFYFELWQTRPEAMSLNCVIKTKILLETLKRSMAPVLVLAPPHPADEEPKFKTINPSLLRFDIFLIATFPLIVLMKSRRFLRVWSLLLLPMFAFAFIPSVAFYVSIMTATAAAVLLRLLGFAALALLISSISQNLMGFVPRSASSPEFHPRGPLRYVALATAASLLTGALLWMLLPAPVLMVR